MDLIKNGNLLRELRKEKGLTQKELAEKLGIVAKTVSKWETGRGFPDLSTLSELSEIFGVSEKSLLCGKLPHNEQETGNIARTKFYVCSSCGSIMQGMGNCEVLCCGKSLNPLQAQTSNNEHILTISEIEDELFLEISHSMSKEHYISFITYLGYDKLYYFRLYPEQDCVIRIPKVYNGKILYYCNQHGLFEYRITRKR